MPDPIHQQCIDAAAAILTGLALSGIGANVVTQLIGDQSAVALPALEVTPDGEAETLAALTSASRLLEYPVRVRLVDAVAGPAPERIPQWLGWRQSVEEAFPDRRAAGYPPGCHGCRVVMREVVNPEAGNQRARGEILLLFKAVKLVPGS